MNNPIDRLKDHLQYRVAIEKQSKLDEDIKHVIKRLEVAEKALVLADDVLRAIYDPYKKDCTVCDAFLTPCKDYCNNEKLCKALEEWRKAKDEQ